jgi:hypothetical protein
VRRELEFPQPPHSTPSSSSLVAYARREWPGNYPPESRTFVQFAGAEREADVDLRVHQLMSVTEKLSQQMLDAVHQCLVVQLYWAVAVLVDAIAIVDMTAPFILTPKSIEVIVGPTGIITGTIYVRLRRPADVWRLLERARCEPYEITRMVRAHCPCPYLRQVGLQSLLALSPVCTPLANDEFTTAPRGGRMGPAGW